MNDGVDVQKKILKRMDTEKDSVPKKIMEKILWKIIQKESEEGEFDFTDSDVKKFINIVMGRFT